VQGRLDVDRDDAGVETRGGISEEPPGTVVRHGLADDRGNPAEELERREHTGAHAHDVVVCPGT